MIHETKSDTRDGSEELVLFVIIRKLSLTVKLHSLTLEVELD